ncbi:hypothetical protein D3C81_2175780 [compost metagenome]
MRLTALSQQPGVIGPLKHRGKRECPDVLVGRIGTVRVGIMGQDHLFAIRLNLHPAPVKLT